MIFENCDVIQAHAFEPVDSTLALCKANLSEYPEITFNNKALLDENKSVKFRVYPVDHSRNGISGVGQEKNFSSDIVTVDCIRGDTYCAEKSIERVNFLKIDAEGYDLHVIQGFEELLKFGAIDLIQFEYTVKHSETKKMLGDYFEFLIPLGYSIGVLRKAGVEFLEFDFTLNSFEHGPNYIACTPTLRPHLAVF